MAKKPKLLKFPDEFPPIDSLIQVHIFRINGNIILNAIVGNHIYDELSKKWFISLKVTEGVRDIPCLLEFNPKTKTSWRTAYWRSLGSNYADDKDVVLFRPD